MSQSIQSITGMNDILPHEIQLWQRLEAKAREIFSNYGFCEIRTPILEDTGLFSRGIGSDTQVVQKEMYTFDDKGGDSVTLRPEGTAGVMRAYLQNSMMAQDAVTKLYYMGPMFRYERPQKGRLRQFHQIGVELMGVDSPYADAEVVIMMDRLTRALGITDYRLEVNSLGTLEERKPYLATLVSFFKTVSGDLCEDCQFRLEKNPLRILDCKKENCRLHAKNAPTIVDSLEKTSREEFETFLKCLNEAGVKYNINPKIVRGLDYYEKTTFEFISDKLGSQSTFSGGGRYNRLALELGSKNPIPAVGFSIGCERTIMLLEDAGANAEPAELNGVYFVGMNESAFLACQELKQQLRDSGLKSEMDYTVKSVKSQMRRANKLGFRYAAIIGESELQKKTVMLKDLKTGDQNEVGFDQLVSHVS